MAILTVVPEEKSQIVFKCQQMVISLAGITSVETLSPWQK
jgi:hypothetical protein